MPEPHLRAADADRSAVADVLGVHMSAGRLTVEEYDDRLARAWSARTYGELAELTTDLPAVPARTAEQPASTPAAGSPWWGHGWYGSCGPRAGTPSLRAAWASWATTALIVIGIWVMSMIGTQDWLYPWPVWVIGPWGAVLLVQTLGARGDDRRSLPS
ncbi:DUF1707 SHOCT-like domain-containing protein [Modestobacter italicus]|uniref:DUF1707 SHOCT-like domain-containing protein n=1 Tax=Modestobacter italicus (strain DSM 44449 / CECT 9708 / BC 501) TaxID=2732864 RepID=UPI001C9813E8|nr:DUF1707 domain-containing protein [Modestobacter italicus]